VKEERGGGDNELGEDKGGRSVLCLGMRSILLRRSLLWTRTDKPLIKTLAGQSYAT